VRRKFSEIFRECRGDDSLSFLKFIGTLELRKNIRELFSKKFCGALNLRGDPEPAKVQGESLEGVVVGREGTGRQGKGRWSLILNYFQPRGLKFR